jgi:hypothetical protein
MREAAAPISKIEHEIGGEMYSGTEKFGRSAMLTEKEFHIVKALVEEEMENVRKADYMNSKVLTNYLFTLSEIIEKLKKGIEREKDLSQELIA